MNRILRKSESEKFEVDLLLPFKRKESHGEEFRSSLEAGKGKEIDISLEPPEICSPTNTLILLQ